MADTRNYKAFGQDIQQRLTDLETDVANSLTKDDAKSLYLGKSDTAASASKLTTNAGSATTPIYFSNGVPVASTYTIQSSVPADAKFTDTWRGIQDNLTSDSSTDSLSAKQGKVLKSSIDTLATDTKSYIKSVSANGTTLTFTKGDDTTSTVNTEDTTYDPFTGASASAAGKAGLVPAPTSGKMTQVLFSDGKWGDIATTTDIAGNAATATKLQTSRTIALSGTVTGAATNFDGSSNITIDTTVDGTKVEGSVPQADLLTLSQGTANESRAIPFQEANKDPTTGFKANYDADFTYNPATDTLNVGTVNSANVVKNITISGKTITATKGDGSTSTLTLPADPTDITGNAATATKLQTAITIGISGAVTGTATSFNGSSNVTIATTSVDGSKVTGTVPAATSDSEDQNIAETYIKGISANGTTITVTKGDGTTSTINTKDTTYSAATDSVLGLVKVGSNITNTSGTISLTKANVTSALGYTPPTTNTEYDVFTGATSTSTGVAGLVPAPTSGKTAQVLRSDGTWSDETVQTTVSGNAGTATKLQTARNISITGDISATEVSFDGSKDISLTATLGSVGTAGTYGSTTDQTLTAGGTFTMPYVTTDTKGRVTVAGTRTLTMPAVQTSVSGNAGTATKLATARTIDLSGAVTGTATSFDGSTNITIATTSVDGTKVTGIVPKATADASGNTITDTYAKKSDVYTKTEVDSKVSGIYSYKGTVDSYDDLPTTGVKTGDVYNIGTALDGKNYAAVVDSEGTISWDDIGGKVDLSSYITKTTADSTYLGKSANAVSASKLATARTISLTGDTTGSVSFDGSDNASIATTLASSGVTAGSYGTSAATTTSFGGSFNVPYVTFDAKGRATSASSIEITMPAAPTSVSGNAGTATKLATARTISLTGDATGSVSFDGSANVDIAATLASSGVTAGTYGPTDNASVALGSTLTIPSVTVDAKGRTTSAASRTITLTAADSSLSSTSTNAIQNKVVYNALAGKMSNTPASIEFTGPSSTAGHGGYIDFHYNGSTDDYTSRIIEDASGKISITASSGVYVNDSKVATATDLSSYLTTSAASSAYLGKTATAAAATKLATARSIALTGDATGSASFDGSANTSIVATLASSGVTAGSYGQSANSTAAFGGTFKVPYVTFDAKGRATAAFTITVTMPAAPTSVSGNAGTATKLATARTIALTGAVTGSASFDGSANASIATTLSSVDGGKITGTIDGGTL